MRRSALPNVPLQQAVLLLTGLPELEAVPFAHRSRLLAAWWLGRFRIAMESLLLDALVVVHWMGLQIEWVFFCGSTQMKRLEDHFPSEFWVGGLLILLTIALIVL